MVKRTSVNLDMELVGEAAEALGTGRTTETVHAALRDVIRRKRLHKLAGRRSHPPLRAEFDAAITAQPTRWIVPLGSL